MWHWNKTFRNNFATIQIKLTYTNQLHRVMCSKQTSISLVLLNCDYIILLISHRNDHFRPGKTSKLRRKAGLHYDVNKWKHFPRYRPFVQVIHQSPVNSPHKGQWRGALVFSLICVWINGWVNNREAGDLRRHRDHYDVSVMESISSWAIAHVYSLWWPYRETRQSDICYADTLHCISTRFRPLCAPLKKNLFTTPHCLCSFDMISCRNNLCEARSKQLSVSSGATL